MTSRNTATLQQRLSTLINKGVKMLQMKRGGAELYILRVSYIKYPSKQVPHRPRPPCLFAIPVRAAIAVAAFLISFQGKSKSG